MNRSGGPVAQWVRFYKLPFENLLVILDDHDLPLGRIRLRTRGSSGGHRGLEDIILQLGSEDFPRLRVGIRTDEEHPDLMRQVLAKIPPRFKDDVDRVIETAADAVETALDRGLAAAMTRFNALEIS